MRDLVIGIGCSSGTCCDEIIALVELTLNEAGLAAGDIVALATIDGKAAEPGVIAAAAHFAAPLIVYGAAELALEAGQVATPSAFVAAVTGTPSVAEAAALKSGRLIVTKHRSVHATCAIARKAVTP